MIELSKAIAVIFAAMALTSMALLEPASAHHVMGGQLPLTFGQGLLSGLGHPIIGLDHFAAVVAVGCLAAAHRFAPALAIAFVLAMILGVAAHVRGTSVPGAEILVALSVVGLGAVMLWARKMSAGTALTLFALVGAVHGYALGESIYGAEQAPLTAYFIGLGLIQSAVALVAMLFARAAIKRSDPVTLRLVGAGIAGIGLAILAGQIVPGA